MFEYMEFNIAPWGHELVLYFFLVGMAAMSFVLAATPNTVGGMTKALQPTQKPIMVIVLVLMAINGYLLITDLGQPARFLYPILHFHASSPLGWGSLFVVGFSACAFLFAVGVFTGKESILKPVGYVGSVLALLLPLYTGWDLMAQQARELWHTASVPAMFVVLSVSSGVALISIVAIATHSMSEGTVSFLRRVLLVAVVSSLVLFVLEWLRLIAGSAEEQQALAYIGQSMGSTFWVATFLLGIILPLVILLVPSLAKQPMAVTVAAVLGTIGAYGYRDVIMTAGQIPQMFY